MRSPVSWLVVILVCGFVVIFELSILAFCKGKPDVTELLVAYEHNLGPVDKDGKRLQLRMANEVREEEAADKRKELLQRKRTSIQRGKMESGVIQNTPQKASNQASDGLFGVSISIFNDDSDDEHLIHTDSDEDPMDDNTTDGGSWLQQSSRRWFVFKGQKIHKKESVRNNYHTVR